MKNGCKFSSLIVQQRQVNEYRPCVYEYKSLVLFVGQNHLQQAHYSEFRITYFCCRRLNRVGRWNTEGVYAMGVDG